MGNRRVNCERSSSLNFSLVMCNSYLVVVGVDHIEQALFRGPGDAERMLQLGVNPSSINIPKSKKVLVHKRQKIEKRSNKDYKKKETVQTSCIYI